MVSVSTASSIDTEAHTILLDVYR